MDPVTEAVLTKELLGDEGNVLRVYDDATGKPIVAGTHVIGNPTICVGRNLAGRGMTEAESKYLLKNDLAQLELELPALLPWLLTVSPNRQAAIYSLDFNLALGNPRHFVAAWPNFLGQMGRGEFAAAADNLENSQPWAHQVGARATRLANLVRYG